ncbi:MAG: hypothetical protein V4850_12410 [Myxococcota bacterium]
MFGLLMMVVACGTAPEVPVEAAPAPVAAPEVPADIEISDLLGTPPPAVMPGLGMRGEGVQNGGPTYGPRLGEIPVGGFGTGTYGTAKKDALRVMHIDPPTVTGPLSADLLQGFFRSESGVRVCTDLLPVDARGALDLRLTIGADGVVGKREVTRSTFANDAALRACLLALPMPTFVSAAAPSVVVQSFRFSEA